MLPPTDASDAGMMLVELLKLYSHLAALATVSFLSMAAFRVVEEEEEDAGRRLVKLRALLCATTEDI